MSKHSSSRIPSVLSLPEKISAVMKRLLRIRFPMERQFSGRDLLLTVLPAFLLLSALIQPLQRFRLPISILAALSAAVPFFFQGFRQVQKKHFPLEEVTILLSSVLAFLLGESILGAVILVLTGLLAQIEAYTLLHRDAASDYLADSSLKLRHAVETADEEKSRERRAFASGTLGFYACFLLAALIFAFCALFHLQDYQIWLKRSLLFMLLSIPSALLFSSMLTHFGAIYSAAKAQIGFSDDQIPEEFSKCRIFAFSKTGTVTDAKFVISDIYPVGVSETELLRVAAIAECQSDHPIATALKAAAGLREGTVPAGLMSSEEIPGKGMCVLFSGHQIYVGNAGLLEDHGIWYQVPPKSGSAIHIAVDNTYRGFIMLSDSLRENAFDALEELRAHGASTLVMLTGDVRSAARTLASSLNFDMVKPELSPEEKGSAIRFLRSSQGDIARIACVGDGLHDAEMFAEGDISICLEHRQESSQADINIESPDILRVPLAYRICRETERMFMITTAGLAAVKLILAIFGLAEQLPLTAVTVIDFVFSAAAVIYALTSFTLDKRG